MKKKIKIDIGKNITTDPMVRRRLARDFHYWFFHIYFSDYITYKTAAFQKEIIGVSQDTNTETAVILAFRGSGKSTIMSLSYPIWAMIGAQEKKHIVILSQTQNLCRLMLDNIRSELERNTQLVRDFGPFKEQSSQWSSNGLIINKYNCRIASMSSEEAMRGTRYLQYRPDLIICDDVEDLSTVKTKEGRDKTYNWLTSEIMPAGDTNTKLIIIGNKLHEDCLMMRLKADIEEGYAAKYMEYPLLDWQGRCLWPEKFPTKEDILKLKSKVASETAWMREFLLLPVSEDDAVIRREWIQRYDDFPQDMKLKYIAVGIDLAISKNNWASYTAMVPANIYEHDKNKKIYILPYPINKRMDFTQTVEEISKLYNTLSNSGLTKLFVEEVGYQGSCIEDLIRQGYPAEGVKPHGQDKRERLAITAPLIKNGIVLFPRKGCEELINQLTRFEYEKHNDLADAFSMMVLKIGQDSKGPGCMTIWEWPGGGVEI